MKDFYKNYLFKNLFTSDFKKRKKILIVGCSGFIGKNLLEILFLKKFNFNSIYGIDIISPQKKNKNFTFFKKDLFKKNLSLPNLKFDYIINLAGIPSPIYYKKKPLETIFLNFDLTRKLLEKSNNDKSKFIYFSSSEIYGSPDKKNIPTSEIYNGNVSTVSDRSCYDESKRAGETITYVYKSYYNLDTKIIRPFNFFGEGMKFNDKRIIPQFFYQLVNNKNITVFYPGKQTRTYCHIIDACIMFIKIIFNGKQFIYNVGSTDKEISSYELAKKIKKIDKKSKSKIIINNYPKNYPKFEPQRRRPDISKYINEFKTKPKLKLDTTLSFFLKYAEKEYKKK